MEIVKYPNPILRQPASPVEAIDDETNRTIDQMIEAMNSHNGIGLAAPQIGVPEQIVVLKNTNDKGEDDPIVLINPSIIGASSTKVISTEGCLSIPGQLVDVSRKSIVCVRALNRNGEDTIIEKGGLLAIALQHEIDHLNGKTIADYLPKPKRELLIVKMRTRKPTRWAA